MNKVAINLPSGLQRMVEAIRYVVWRYGGRWRIGVNRFCARYVLFCTHSNGHTQHLTHNFGKRSCRFCVVHSVKLELGLRKESSASLATLAPTGLQSASRGLMEFLGSEAQNVSLRLTGMCYALKGFMGT